MTSQKFESIKSSIESAKKKSTMAEGRKQSIEEKLLKDFDIEGDIVTEVEDRLEKDKKSVDKDTKIKDKTFEILEIVSNYEENYEWDSEAESGVFPGNKGCNVLKEEFKDKVTKLEKEIKLLSKKDE